MALFNFNTFIPFPDANDQAAQDKEPSIATPGIMAQEPTKNKSPLGTDWVHPYSIQGGSYVANASGQQKSYPGFDFPPTTIVGLARGKHIVETAVAGNDDVVQELISLNLWEISITGFLNRNDNTYPDTETAALRAILEVPASLQVTGKKFNVHDIRQIVIRDWNIPAVEGSMVQPFSIRATSDKPIILNLQKKQ